VLVRYNSNGSLDTTFGAGGIVEVQDGIGSPAAGATLQRSLSGRERWDFSGVQLYWSAAIHGDAEDVGGPEADLFRHQFLPQGETE